MTHSMPTRKDLIRKLEDLSAGILTRDQVAKWAISIIDSDIRFTDEVVWRVLEGLGAVDLPSSDREYLYTIEDFEAWKNELLDR